MASNATCPSCGSQLKIMTIQTPVWGLRLNAAGRMERVIIGYRETEDYADCIRCHGAY